MVCTSLTPLVPFDLGHAVEKALAQSREFQSQLCPQLTV